MPTTHDFSAAELINELRSRGIVLHVNGSKLQASSQSPLTDCDRLLIREHKAELLRLLDMVGDAAPEVIRHQEAIPVECFSTTVESWDERGIANLVAIARQAGIRLEHDSTTLMIDGPSTPIELHRLLREQAAGIMLLLKTSCSARSPEHERTEQQDERVLAN